MTKLLTSILTITVAFLLLISCSPSNDSEKRSTKMTKEEKIEALAEQEFEMTHDPATGDVPRERLHKTISYLKENQDKSMINLSWEERGPDNFAGRVRTMILDLNDPSGTTMWTGGIAGGIWKATDIYGEYQWENIAGFTGNVAVSSLVQDPVSTNIMYAGTGEGWFNADAYRGDGIYKSVDGGTTWDRLISTAGAEFRYIQKLLISDGRLFACTRDRGIQVSDDGGESWSKSLGNGQFGFSERISDIERANDGVLYASGGIQTQDGIYKSIDNGLTWEYFDIEMPDFERIEIAVAPNNSDVVYGLVQDSETNGAEIILRTQDGGLTWDQLEGPGANGMDNFARNQAWYDLSLGVDPTDENRVFIGGVDVLASKNGGDSWTQISQWFGGFGKQFVHADQHVVLYLDETGDRVAYANDGGIFITTNAKATVPTINNINKNLNITQFYSCDVASDPSSDLIIGGTQDNGTHRFTNQGINATDRVSGGDGGYCHIDQNNPDIQVSAFTFNNYRVTLDGWETSQGASTDQTEGYFINPSEYDDEHHVLYASAEPGNINILDVFSLVIDSVAIPNIGAQRITAIEVNPFDSERIYVGTNSGRVVQIDSILTNPQFTTLGNAGGFVKSIEVNPNNPNEIVTSNSNFGTNSVFYSSNAGESFTSIHGNLPDFPVRWAVFNPSNPNGLIIATELGIWSTDNIDGGNTGWGISSEGMPLTRVDMLKFREADNMLVAATHGRGIFTSSSFDGNYIYIDKGYVEQNENTAAETNDGCSVGHTYEVTVLVNELEADTLFFNVGHQDLVAKRGLDFEYDETEIFILPNEKQTTFEVIVFGDYMRQGERDFKILVDGVNNTYKEEVLFEVSDEESDYTKFNVRLMNTPSPTLYSSAHSGNEMVFTVNDSLWLVMDGEAINDPDCIATRMLHNNSDKVIETAEYKISPKIVYITNENQLNEYSIKLFLNNSEKGKINDNVIYGLYNSDSLTSFDNVIWEVVEDAELTDLGLSKNFVEFAYQGPGSYTVGFVFDYVNTVETDFAFSISPNPVSDVVNINCTDCKVDEVIIIDATGKEVYRSKSSTNSIDVSFLHSGFYFISASIEGKQITEKIFKK